MATKKLIEVALPLEKINAESAREKSIRHGHPSTLHLWWARRPLAAARAVIWSSLVDDPSSHPELFPTEEDQNKERQRLFKILEDLVDWDNSNDERIIGLAKEEIRKSIGDAPISLLDPFAGGGTIPLEAQRLGLSAHAHDLNPVAVMINKAMVEIPSRFNCHAPINPEIKRQFHAGGIWSGAKGIAEDVRFYGDWIKQEAFKRIGHLYPKVQVPQSQGGGEATVIAWIWARTVKCPNPACGCEMPLASSFVISKKKGQEAYIEPSFEDDKIKYTVRKGKGAKYQPKVKGSNFVCVKCGETATGDYIRNEAKEHRLGKVLVAIIAEGNRGRLYLSPSIDHSIIADSARSEWRPTELVTNPCHDVDRLPMYGMPTWGDAFTERQLTVLSTLSNLTQEAQKEIERHAIDAGMPNDHIPISKGGRGALAYSQAIAVYLAFAVDRCADYYSMFATWSGEFIAHTFGRQAIPMVWDFAECNPFSNSTGNWSGAVNWVCSAVERFPNASCESFAIQSDAQTDCGLRNIVVSTDPPYYDNIKSIYPELFGTMLVPKADELVATPHRFEGDAEKAKSFFESGMSQTCKLLYQYSSEDIPVTIYYAYKQSETDKNDDTTSTGWETMLSAIIHAGFSITGTWPMRTERTVGIKGHTNMLASSIILVCKKKQNDSRVCTRRNFINELKRELRPALKKLQSSNIAPVDLAQSAIGPGMGVYSKYSQVLEADGTPMSVRSALKVINQELDLYFNEQDSEIDSESRFCVELFSMVAFNDMKFGDANILANAKGTSVASMVSHGTLYAQKGVVHLIDRSELPEKIDERESSIWKLCQQLSYRMEKEGIEGCAKAVSNMFGTNAERAKDLAYRLYTIAERKKWAGEALVYNNFVVSWPEIQSRAAELKAIQPEQLTIFDN